MRPQDFLGTITVGLHEITNEPYRSTSDEDDLADLVELITAKVEFLPPLVSRTRSGRLMLLAGGRRFEATRAAGRTRIKVYSAHDLTGLLAWLELDAREPGGTRMTKSELGRFTSQAAFQLQLNGRQIGQVDRQLMRVHDYGLAEIQYSRQLLKRLDGSLPGPEREQLVQGVADVDAGLIQASSVLSRETINRKRALLVANAAPAGDQQKTLRRALPSLRGTVEALRTMGPVSPEVPIEARTEALKVIHGAARELSLIARQIRQLGESTS